MQELFGKRIETSLKNTKRATYAKEGPAHSSPPKKYKKIYIVNLCSVNLSPGIVRYSCECTREVTKSFRQQRTYFFYYKLFILLFVNMIYCSLSARLLSVVEEETPVARVY
jgi:hypothetical protein